MVVSWEGPARAGRNYNSVSRADISLGISSPAWHGRGPECM